MSSLKLFFYFLKALHHKLFPTLIRRYQFQALAAQSVQPYLRTRQCRWQFLLQAFGWLSEAKNLACGQCDNCRRFKFKL